MISLLLMVKSHVTTQPLQVCKFTANSWASEPKDGEVDVEESAGVAWKQS
jgi:hypothetical protein